MSSHKKQHSWKRGSHGRGHKKGLLGKATNFYHQHFTGKKPKELIKNLLLAAVALGLFGLIVLLILVAWWSRDLPDPGSLSIREVPQATKIYDRSGEHLLYEIHGEENRTLLRVQEGFCNDDDSLDTDEEGIPLYALQATVAAEDENFCNHKGFSVTGIARAVLFAGNRGGGSTITQQLIKNAVLTNERSIIRKVKELILAVGLERRYSKDEILQIYFNEIPYGSTYYGIETASQNYLGKSAYELTLSEAATLAGLPQRPTAYVNNPDLMLERRDWILDQMVSNDFITEEEAAAAKAEEVVLQQRVGGIEAPHFVLWVKEQLEEEYGQRTVEQGGLKVITTLDYDMQKVAEEAVADNIEARSERYNFNNSGLVAMDPKTGQVLSLVGSADYFNEEIDGQVNVTRMRLQPGSSIKPIIYAAGFEAGYTPNTLLWDAATNFPSSSGAYTPQNYNGTFIGPVTIRKALQGSLNIPAVKMLALLGVQNGLDFAEKLGYTFENREQYGLAVVLGGAEVKLIEHVGAYAVFANAGVKQEATMILSVEDGNGDMLYEWEETSGDQVIDSNVAAMITNVLADDGARAYAFGTGSLLTLGGRPVAAKTGTTNDYKDAWTVGYTPSLVAGVWTGNTDGTRMNGAGGSTAAAPVWNQFMRGALAGTAVESFPAPSIPNTGKAVLDGELPSEQVVIDTVSGKLATEYTPEEYREEKVCGEYHSILHYINPSNPRGNAPSNPASNSMYSAWEAGVAGYIERNNANLEEGEAPLESCEIPTEYDDVHTPENEPRVRINNPDRGDNISNILNIELSANANRSLARVETLIDETIIDTRSFRSSYSVSIPSWVDSGDHDLTVRVSDDVGNVGEASTRINISSSNTTTSSYQITNPHNTQVISADAQSYTVVAERRGEEAESVTITVTSTRTGSSQTLLSSGDPQPIESAEWNLNGASGPYLVQVYSTYEDGTQVTGRSAYVIVQPGSGGGGLLDPFGLLGGEDEEVGSGE